MRRARSMKSMRQKKQSVEGKNSVGELAKLLKSEFKGLPLRWKVAEWNGKGCIVGNGYFKSTGYSRSQKKLIKAIEEKIKDNFSLNELIALHFEVNIGLEETVDERLEINRQVRRLIG